MELSEYGSSFVTINDLLKEYKENLTFRMRKRASEYTHQPFSVGSNDFSPVNCVNSVSAKESSELRVPELKTTGSQTFDGSLTLISCGDDSCGGRPVAFNGKSDVPVVVGSKDFATQTNRSDTLPGQRKVPRSNASRGSYQSGAKSAFNVNSSMNARRSTASTTSRYHGRITEQRASTTSVDDHAVKSQDCRSNGRLPDFVEPSCDVPNNRGFTTRTSSTIGKSPNSVRLPDRCGDWISEYNSQYPLYPSSIYARSASITASRCRPPSSQYNASNASRITSASVHPPRSARFRAELKPVNMLRQFRDCRQINQIDNHHTPAIITAL